MSAAVWIRRSVIALLIWLAGVSLVTVLGLSADPHFGPAGWAIMLVGHGFNGFVLRPWAWNLTAPPRERETQRR